MSTYISSRRIALALMLLCAAAMTAALFADSPGFAATGSTSSTGTSAEILAALFPDRLGARSTLRFEIRYSGQKSGEVPSPVHRALLSFPAGLTLAIPHLSSCSAPRLRTRGARGCSPQSDLGTGHALVVAPLGSQTLSETISLSLFLGEPHNLQPTVEILGRGLTPFNERVLLSGATLSGQPPTGKSSKC